MKKSRVISALACALIGIILNQSLHATILVQGNASTNTTTTTLATPVLAKVYDNATASFIVSTGPISSSTANPYAITTVNGTFGSNLPSFIPIAPDFAENLNPIALTLATSYGSPSPNIAFLLSQASNTNTSTQVNITSLSSLGGLAQQSSVLRDASGAINANGQNTSLVGNIAANAGFIFGAVAPNSNAPSNTFGTTGSGVAVVSINPETLTLTQISAAAGDSGIKAAPFNGTTQELLLAGTSVNINPNKLPNSTQLTYPAMVWDDLLQRLYIGYDLETLNTIDAASSSGGLSITAAYLKNASGTLGLQKMAPSAAFIPNNDTYMIGVIFDENCDVYDKICNPGAYYPDGCDPNIVDPTDPNYCYGEYPPSCYCPEAYLSVHRLAVLHASTGPSYLIVNGGNGTRSTTGNLIYALPLVDNPGSVSHGRFASRNSSPVNGKFVIPAALPGDLTTNLDSAAIVGAGPFPIQASSQLADLVVVGDTVYASSSEPLSSVSESGIFYSQAMFDETGKIIRWTPWTKRSFPYGGFNNNSPQAGFFSIDAGTGDIWAVDGKIKQTVVVTSWDKGTSTSLVGQLNQQLSSNPCSSTCYKGCYSVLDLDQSTRGFYANTCSRYALFGGINKVIFAQVSQSLDLYCGQYPGDNVLSPQNVITDYTQPENLLTTTLTECGAVTTLEYARRGDINTPSDTNENYFYAGTQNGLFVFANPQGNAINVDAFGDLNQPPFSNGMWFKAPNINGSVIDIKTTGNMLYVLTTNSTPAAPLQGTLYRIPFAPSVNAMFAPGNIIPIAQTMTAPTFKTVLRFTGIQIISTASDGSTEQLVLSTTRGVYQSMRPAGVQAAANQTDANWQLVNNSDNNFYLGIGGMNTSIPIAPPSTVWPFNLQDPLGFKIYDKGSIYQLNGSNNSSPFAFKPPLFNSINSSKSANFTTLDPITYFWSDGGRRFFIINPSQKGCTSSTSNTLLVLPYDTIGWDITQPDQNIDLDPILNTIESYNWIQDIGATGIIIAGTNQGVVGLE